MPSTFVSRPYTRLNLGVNLRGLTGGVNMTPGEAQDAVDVLPREDGGIFKHYGWLRINPAALTGRPLAIKGFSYKGKNATSAGGDTARTGNYGIADTGADFTRRVELYSGCIVLTTSTFYRWDAASESFVAVSLPAGVTADPNPKPSIIVYNNNLYIVGWSSQNLRYDPTDELLYRWGWESTPAAPTNAAQAGGALIADATYRYAYTWLDIYTGEESVLGAALSVTPTGSNLTSRITVAQYAGTRHFNDLAVVSDTDVAVVLYRTDADREVYNFLTVLNPGVTTFDDDGDVTDASIHPFQGTQQDEPRFDAITLFRDQFYAITAFSTTRQEKTPATPNRVYWNDFTSENSFVERWRVADYRELPLPEGEILTALTTSDTHILAFTEEGAYTISAVPNYASGRVDRVTDRLPWTVGCVGPKAVTLLNGWLYFLSKRGPYRWRSGMTEPMWVGRPVASLFLDPTSGLCKLTAGYRREAEVKFDQDANVVRWIFPTGATTTLNTHLMYWAEADKYLEDPSNGWFFASPKAQCFDYVMALSGLTATGLPPDPVTTIERMAFGDDDGYINLYSLEATRGGLPSGSLASGAAQAGSTGAVLQATTAANPLLTQNDGLTGMRLEVQHASGQIETRRIVSNTATAITISPPFDVVPVVTTTSWWVAGIPSFWRSWVDHAGEPHTRKSLLHLYLTYMLTDLAATTSLDVAVLSGDRSLLTERTRTASLGDFNEQLLISRTGLYFAYEIANSRPDEMWVLTAIEPELMLLGEKRRE